MHVVIGSTDDIAVRLPAWLPWWIPILILVPLLLYGLVFFLMPFSVMGVKGRLETLDARLDEIQGEIRSLALRLPEPLRGGYDELPYVSPLPGTERVTRTIPAMQPTTTRPPIPPAPQEPGRAPLGPSRQGAPRAEPRLDWPRG